MDVNRTRDAGISPPPAGAPFDGREFHNLDDAPAGGSFADVLRWKFLGGPISSWPAHPAPDAVPPDLPATLGPGEMAALPEIAAVLVSHGHFDHLDLPTLRRLEKRFRPLFLAGLGQGTLLRGSGLTRIQELDWWHSWRMPPPAGGGDGLEVIFTPAQHWSARSFLTRNRALWGGFWLQHGALKAFHAGDSGLGPHFPLIRERLGRPDVAFLPIGAYEPRWFMCHQHMNPDDAVQAHLELNAATSVGMHFGTFQLTDEGIDEPARALAASLQARGVRKELLVVPRFGETIRFSARISRPG
jgi:L-ascorbate metabolism protein UlaG (beta-lactamase superfamily)